MTLSLELIAKIYNLSSKLIDKDLVFEDVFDLTSAHFPVGDQRGAFAELNPAMLNKLAADTLKDNLLVIEKAIGNKDVMSVNVIEYYSRADKEQWDRSLDASEDIIAEVFQSSSSDQFWDYHFNDGVASEIKQLYELIDDIKVVDYLIGSEIVDE